MPQRHVEKIVPLLWSSKEAEEVVRFYAIVFCNSWGDRVTLMSKSPRRPLGSVKAVNFTRLDQRFQANRTEPHHNFDDGMSMEVLRTHSSGCALAPKEEERAHV